MIFEEIATGGCRSYLIGCDEERVAAIVDPALERCERYPARAAALGLRIQYLIDTHTHADHFSATRELAARLGAGTVMHRAARAPAIDVSVEHGNQIAIGSLRLRVIHTPGHTADSMCLVLRDRVLTGDTLLRGSIGRTDLPTGDPEAMHESLFGRLLREDASLLVFPAHEYRSTGPTSLGDQRLLNPRLQAHSREAFAEGQRALHLELPTHLTEALRTNCSGGKPVSQLIHEAARRIAFVGIDELRRRVDAADPTLRIVDVREAHHYAAGHLPGALHIPRGQLELVVDEAFPDPEVPILTYCEFGKVSTLAAATLRALGFRGAVALDGGFRDWVARGHPVEHGPATPQARRG